jgi:hypothetical protein
MIRAPISRDEHAYRVAKKQARKLGVSFAEFVRKALPKPGQGPWMKYAGLVETGSPLSSQSIDGIIYGQRD